MNTLAPMAGSLSSARLLVPARPTPAAPVAAPARAVPAASEDAGVRSTGNLIRTASEQLDQFDRVMEKLRSSMAGGAVTYCGAPSMGQGQIVDRLA